jgi:DNA-directed RNA polymerase specialized sigma subunit
MERDLFRATESMLRNHEATKLQLVTLERYLEAMAQGDCEYIEIRKSNVRPAGTAVQERTVIKKEDHDEYKMLSLKIEAIENAYKALPEILQEFVRLFYWRNLCRVEVMAEMNITERDFTRKRNRAVRKVEPFVRVLLQ